MLLEEKQKKQVEQLVCVTTYGAHTNKFKGMILKNWHLLDNLEFPLPKPLFAMRKNKSIGQHIIKAELPKSAIKNDLRSQWGLKPIDGHKKCGNCAACSTTIEGSDFAHNEVKCKHLDFTNCKSKNTIYAIVCPCKKLYIGKTTQQVNTCITQHRSRIKKKVQNAPMVEHYSEKGHVESDMRWTVLATIKPTRTMDVDKPLLKKEAYLILKFHSAETGLKNMTKISRI